MAEREVSSAGATRGPRPFTRADIEAAPDDGVRYEVIDGVLVMSAAPGRLHQRAVGRLFRLLDDACPLEFEVLVAPFSVSLADDTDIQPDVVVAWEKDLTARMLPAPPMLAVEVLSYSTRAVDLNVKRERLDRAGVPAFWAVDPVADPADARLMVWERGEGGVLRRMADVIGEQAFEATVPFPVRVVPADLVRGRGQ